MIKLKLATAAVLLAALLLSACGRQPAPEPTEPDTTAPATSAAPTTTTAPAPTAPPTAAEYYSREAIAARQEWVAGDFTSHDIFAREYVAYAYPDSGVVECAWQNGYAAPDAMFTAPGLGGVVSNYLVTLQAGDGSVTLPVQVVCIEADQGQYLSAILEGDAVTQTRPEGYALLRGDSRYAPFMRDFEALALPPGTETVPVDDAGAGGGQIETLDMGAYGTVVMRDDNIYHLLDGRERLLVEAIDSGDENCWFPWLYAKLDDSRFVYGANGWEWNCGVNIYDLATQTVVYSGIEGGALMDFYPILITEDTLWLKESYDMGGVRILNLIDYTLRDYVLPQETGISQWGFCLSPDGTRAAVRTANSATGAESLLVFDTRSTTEIARYPIEPTAGYLYGIGFRGQRLYMGFHHYATDEAAGYLFPEAALAP